MGVGFITGRLCTDRLEKIFDICFEEAKRESREPIFILVPEKNSYEVEKRYSERLILDKDPYFRIRVVTFSSLSNIVFTNVGGLVENKLSKSARSMLIYKAIESVSKDLKTIKLNGGVGLVNKMLDLIIEFKQNNMSVEDVFNMVEKIDDEELNYRLSDYSKIYKKYEELIVNEYLDLEDNLDMFARELDEFKGIRNATILVSEFTGFTPIQYNILEKLIYHSKNTYISLVTDLVNFNFRKGVFSKTNITFLKINEICQKYGIKRLKDINLYSDNYYDNIYLTYLEKEINKFKADPLESSCLDEDYKIKNHLRISQFSNIYEEVRYVADEIMRLVKNEGYRYSDITVASRDIDMYSYLLNVIFEDYDIRYFLDQKFSAKFNPVVIFLLSILKMKLNNYSYESVFKYLKTGFSNMTLDEISKLENYVLENGIKGKMWFVDNWEYPISHSIEDDEVFDLTEINTIKQKMFTPIEKLHNKLKGRNRVGEICRYIYEFLLDVGLDKRISNIIQDYEEKEDIYKSLEYNQVWKIIVKILDEMYNFVGNEYISIDKFLGLLEAEFEGVEIGIVPPGRDEVKITSVDRMSSSNIKALFLLGAIDGIFPANLSESSIIGDKDRDKLLKIGVKFDADSMSKYYDEQYLVYKSMASSKSKLFISYFRTNFDGKEMAESPIIKKIKKIFPSLKEDFISKDIKDIDILNDRYSKEGIFVLLENNFKKINTHNNNMLSILLWSSIYNYFLNDENYKKRAEMMDKALGYSNKVESLGEFISNTIYGKGIFSVSKLEKYASCPFSYFLNYGLRLKSKNKLEFSALDSGLYNHKILDEFSKTVLQNGISWMDLDRAFIEKEVRNISSRLMLSRKNYILNSSKKYFYMANRINNSLVDSIEVMVEQIKRGNFEPSGFEVEFGLGEGINPIKYKLNNGNEVMLIGKIDRVDICSENETDFIRLIDYKSSTRDLDINKIYEGLQMQLFIYMRAILESKKRIDYFRNDNKFFNYKPAALLYSRFNISDISLKNYEELSNSTTEDLNESLLKENKLKGFLIKDKDIVKNLDKTISEYNKRSSIMSIEMNKGGAIGSRTKGIDPDEFRIVNDYVFEKAKEVCESIYSGNIDILPFKYEDELACRFCEYKSICQFDITTGQNKYNLIKKLAKNNKLEDILSKMKKVLESKNR